MGYEEALVEDSADTGIGLDLESHAIADRRRRHSQSILFVPYPIRTPSGSLSPELCLLCIVTLRRFPANIYEF
jgi:hypothetical protein